MKLTNKIKHWILGDDLHWNECLMGLFLKWAFFVTISVVTVSLIVLAAALLIGCGPECAPVYSVVVNATE